MQPQISFDEEVKVGISEFISKGGQILGVTKYILTDFVVNQIDTNGKLITLTRKPQFIQKQQIKPQDYSFSKELYQQSTNLLGLEVTKQIQTLYEKLSSGQKIGKWEIQIPAVEDKSVRSKLHIFVREKLINIDSNTIDGKIKLMFKKNLKKRNPANLRKYIHFTLFKYNIDTAGALYRLSFVTGLNTKLFSSAGLKDKRGGTFQRVSVFNSELYSLRKFYQNWERNRQIWIDDFTQGQENSVGVGDLQGNQFGLIIRLVNPKDAELIEERVKSMKQQGMINYFGMQRFGSYKTKTHEVGIECIRKNWKKVIEMILLQDMGDGKITQIKKQIYEEQNFSQAEKLLPNKLKVQKLLFRALAKQNKNYFNAFESLPRSMKTIYIHALQSYLWNRVVSRRIRQYGLKLQYGDLVGFKSEQKILSNHKEQKQQEQQQDLKQENDILQEEEDIELDIINENNIQKYQITDLVAPLYGPSVKLPENSILHKYFMEQFQNIGLQQKDFSENSKLLCFQGRYRKLMIKPQIMACKIIHHKGLKDQLQSFFYTMGEETKIQQGKLIAVQLTIRLPKSSYATMALREFLHCPTTFQAQKQLNKLYEAQIE